MTTHDREQIIAAAKEAGCNYADLLYDIAGKIEEIRALAYEDGAASRDAEVATLQEQVTRLLFAVIRKFPNESRFETALRYICEAELNAIEVRVATEVQE